MSRISDCPDCFETYGTLISFGDTPYIHSYGELLAKDCTKLVKVTFYVGDRRIVAYTGEHIEKVKKGGGIWLGHGQVPAI